MNHENDPLLLDHEIDGIRELDNRLPRWWVWLFYGSIAFAAMYMTYYHVMGSGKMMEREYKTEMESGAKIKNAAMGRFESNIGSLEPSKDPQVIAAGSEIFRNLCAPCHRPDGGGLVGPNLTDDYWIHGSRFADNVTTIWNGVPEKGMVTWKNSLRPDQIVAVASYIYTLRGTTLQKPGKPREDQAPAAPAGPSEFE